MPERNFRCRNSLITILLVKPSPLGNQWRLTSQHRPAMPGPDGLLTPEEQAKLNAWMAEKVKNPNCPVCNSNSWGIGQHMVREDIFRGSSFVIGGPVYPMVFM